MQNIVNLRKGQGYGNFQLRTGCHSRLVQYRNSGIADLAFMATKKVATKRKIYNSDKQTNKQTGSKMYVTMRTQQAQRLLNPAAGARKENEMDEMSGFEQETFLKMILEILNGCKNLDEAKDKIKALLER